MICASTADMPQALSFRILACRIKHGLLLAASVSREGVEHFGNSNAQLILFAPLNWIGSMVSSCIIITSAPNLHKREFQSFALSIIVGPLQPSAQL